MYWGKSINHSPEFSSQCVARKFSVPLYLPSFSSSPPLDSLNTNTFTLLTLLLWLTQARVLFPSSSNHSVPTLYHCWQLSTSMSQKKSILTHLMTKISCSNQVRFSLMTLSKSSGLTWVMLEGS